MLTHLNVKSLTSSCVASLTCLADVSGVVLGRFHEWAAGYHFLVLEWFLLLEEGDGLLVLGVSCLLLFLLHWS